MKPTTFAVVDIETTGTDPKVDSIIQFGCVLVENEKIVSRFAADIHPDQPIPRQIQSLTGITNARVQKAPYFEDVAYTIYNLLQDTVFVAHNIYFDYHFLNEALMRCGMPELKIPGIDTVELSQIFLPTEPSFRLKDLADSLGLVHENPHQADSDAEVTAMLLLKIREKIRSLPIVTVEKIQKLSSCTGMETKNFIQKILETMKADNKPLPENLEVVEGIALQKKTVNLYSEDYYSDKEYPRTPSQKKKLFKGKLEFRIEQHQLMNLVQKHFTTDKDKDLVIEAATGMGKTMGYLMPLSYLATPDTPAVISTASIVLQEQILHKDIPLLNQILHQPIQATLVKSARHYLDLQRFAATLQEHGEGHVENKQYTLYQMAVLVWLTETMTGDFDELHMTNLSHNFWNEVCHHGIEYLSKELPFYQEDFLVHLHRQMKQSSFLIVNHAFLAQESLRKVPALPVSDYLVIDEAHHLGDNLERTGRQRFSSIGFEKYIHHLAQPGSLFDSINGLLEGYEAAHQFQVFRNILTDALTELEAFFTELLHLVPQSTQKKHQGKDSEEIVIESTLFAQLSEYGEKKLQKALLLFADLVSTQESLERQLLTRQDNWSLSERRNYFQLFTVFERTASLQKIFYHWAKDWDSRYIHWLAADKNGRGATVFIHDYQASVLTETFWYPRYQKIIYLGAAISVGKDRHYFPKRWGLPETKVKVLKNPYDFSKQVRVFIPDEAADIGKLGTSEHAEFVVKTIFQLARQEKRRFLVLFTSHELLQEVYMRAHLELLNQGREMLAQGIGGSREKILKRFFLSEDDILLGADSFWEGIDLPGDTLQLLVVTRLPFENPKRPLVKARYAYLESQAINPFYQDAVPKTALKLRQALGRLIRSEEDRGVMIVLDKRLVAASYSKRLLTAFPDGLSIEEKSMTKILEDTKEFLTKISTENMPSDD